MTLGQTLKKARIDRCLTQKRLGEIIGITPQTISYYETDAKTPGLAALRKYCEALDLDPAELAALKYGSEEDQD